jgi:hypothetical protein
MRHRFFAVCLLLLASCGAPTQGFGTQQSVSDEVHYIPVNPGLTPVSLLSDDLNDLIVRSFSMMTGTSMGMRVTVLANTRRLGVSAGDEREDRLFGPATKDWTKSAFAAVPFARGPSSNPPADRNYIDYIDLEIHEGVCWHDDIQFFQKFRASRLLGTYAVIASVEPSSDANGYDDLDGAKTRAMLYVLRKAEPPTTGFAGVFSPVEFSFLMTAEVPKASCRPAEMSAEYERIVKRSTPSLQ